eukprot:scaffold2653_cov111-Isochrysis_galbana.AAC.2
MGMGASAVPAGRHVHGGATGPSDCHMPAIHAATCTLSVLSSESPRAWNRVPPRRSSHASMFWPAWLTSRGLAQSTRFHTPARL